MNSNRMAVYVRALCGFYYSMIFFIFRGKLYWWIQDRQSGKPLEEFYSDKERNMLAKLGWKNDADRLVEEQHTRLMLRFYLLSLLYNLGFCALLVAPFVAFGIYSPMDQIFEHFSLRVVIIAYGWSKSSAQSCNHVYVPETWIH